jgi:hypothetical protein
MSDPDPLSVACERVGRWLWHFAHIERTLGEGIIRFYRLQGVAGEILAANLDFSRKVNIVQTMAVKNEGDPVKTVDALCSEIRAINDERQIVAHTLFEPATNGSVRFRRATAKRRVKMDLAEWTWTPARFASDYIKMSRINTELQALVDLLAR